MAPAVLEPFPSNSEEAEYQAPESIPLPPTFKDAYSYREHLKSRLVLAYRLAAKNGFDEGVVGHITIKDPVDPTCFWINPFGCNWNTLKASELLLVNSKGVVVDGGKSRLLGTAAFIIHHTVHLARPEIMCVVHAHTLYGKSFSSLGRKLEMITQDSCIFHNDHGFQSSFTGGLRSERPAKDIADALGPHKMVLLQNHGILTVGETVESAFFWFKSAETCCHSQLMADAAASGRGGKPSVIEDSDAQHSYSNSGGENAGWFNGRPMFEQMALESGNIYLQ